MQAQANGLGLEYPQVHRPEGATLRLRLGLPLQGDGSMSSEPRALPWPGVELALWAVVTINATKDAILVLLTG